MFWKPFAKEHISRSVFLTTGVVLLGLKTGAYIFRFINVFNHLYTYLRPTVTVHCVRIYMYLFKGNCIDI